MNNQQIGEVYAQKVEKWIKDRNDSQDFMEYRNGKKINRSALIAELDFSRSVVNQNKEVKRLLSEAEKEWYGSQEDEDTAAHQAARERSEKKASQRNTEISKLEDEIAKLKAENAALRKQLYRFEAMEEVIQKTGMSPHL